MEVDILKMVATQGLFAILFTYLLFYVLKENSKREFNYQNIVKELTEMLPPIKEDVEKIKEKVFK
ncbi:BhlA/UviB family holin-like peptide [Clostridium tarantellae]|uniref:Bacteriocin n=1 Tax=Clostridium tarantellae TaxID=39493 RepID=A0A6I1MM47_9CLOT|nr:BhlA/UviB family holin-like peptide [Clostridium tarantellae]MPQ43823.1 bacteriocin [Clostridium tarantellae]